MSTIAPSEQFVKVYLFQFVLKLNRIVSIFFYPLIPVLVTFTVSVGYFLKIQID